MRLRPALAFLLSATALLAAEEPIKLGMFASLTGKQASFGQTNRRGALFAVEEINAAGGVLGRPLELLVEDTRSLQGEAATAVKKLITRDRVTAVVSGTGSSAALEAAPVCQTAGVPLMAATATNARVTEAGDYIFRACFIDPFQGTVLAKFARETLHARRVAVLVANGSAYSVGLAKYFRERFTADGGEIAAEQKYSEGDKDFRAQLTALKTAAPDAIFASGDYTESALICVQARALGLTVPLFGGDTWDTPALTQIGGKSVEGGYFSAHFSPDSSEPAVRDFVQRFRARWGEPPDTGTSLGYDAVMLLADALRRAGTTDGKKLRDALAATQDFAGVTGRITVDAQRNASKSAVIFTVKNGRFEFLQSIGP
ncbi:MAG: ABC transporter substrate-binding protein [Opitutae bacterium]|nr:ABC transporter substrate-binding protein [Opitutae bacterium]